MTYFISVLMVKPEMFDPNSQGLPDQPQISLRLKNPLNINIIIIVITKLARLGQWQIILFFYKQIKDASYLVHLGLNVILSDEQKLLPLAGSFSLQYEP